MSSLQSVLKDLIEKNINVEEQLKIMSFVINYVFSISSETDRVLSLTHKALENLYKSNDDDVDLSTVSLLSNYCDKLLENVNKYFRNVYIHQIVSKYSMLTPHFNFAWTVCNILFDI